MPIASGQAMPVLAKGLTLDAQQLRAGEQLSFALLFSVTGSDLQTHLHKRLVILSSSAFQARWVRPSSSKRNGACDRLPRAAPARRLP